MVTTPEIYLPNVIAGVHARTKAYFEGLASNPFTVYFETGILPAVRRKVFQDGLFPLVWLVMKYDEEFGRLGSHRVSFSMFIAMPTLATYTQLQREAATFEPYLMPIYRRLIYEIENDKSFRKPPGKLPHRRTFLPYWGMGDVDGIDQPNLFKDKFIDAIKIDIADLALRTDC